MDRLNNDYSYWKYFEVWHVADAWNIIKYYNLELMSDLGEHDKRAILWKWKRQFDKNAEMFAYDIVWVDSIYEGSPEQDELNDYIQIVGDKSKVDKNEFIKWAYSERIPLPPEIMDLVKHNWENGELKPNSEMSKDDYAALTELPLLKKTVIELREYVLVLKNAIYGATRTPWSYIIEHDGSLTLEKFKAEFKSDGYNTPDDLIEKIYRTLPLSLTQQTYTAPPEEIT